ncbi:hypothetical protein RW64_20690 [Geobacter sulfurreducens]|nr:hypothetical protein RW64_20690 [Geobacter sulfurreducens]
MPFDNLCTKGESDELLGELVCELKLLRTLVREVGENFILRREGEIESILAHVENLPRRSIRREVPELLRDLHRLRLKPRKGRLRDLKEIDRLVDDLMESLVEIQGDECRQELARRRTDPKSSTAVRNVTTELRPA